MSKTTETDPPARKLSPAALEFFREAGRRGGQRCLAKHGRKFYSKIGVAGGAATAGVPRTRKPAAKKRAS